MRASRGIRCLVLLAVPFMAGGQGRSRAAYEQVPYNGGFTFTRIRYGGDGSRRGGGNAWNHDCPHADMHLSKLIEYISTIPINVVGTNVYDLDDPGIFRHPIIYLSEPGFW